jgi:hypothetical protein
MEITEVSTRSIAEIDVNRLVMCHISPPPGGLPFAAELEGGTARVSTGVSILGAGAAPSYDVLVVGSSTIHGMVSAIQCKSASDLGQQSVELGRGGSRAAFEHFEPWVKRVVLSNWWQPTGRIPGQRGTGVQIRALTNWLRAVANNESSRPILDLGELSRDQPADKSRIPVSISPSLRRESPATKVGGLGHVSAALLLWLESSDADCQDL